jgi:agmatinase
MALERAWDGCDVYLSYDIDSIEAAFVPGTDGLNRWTLRSFVPAGLVAAPGLCGMYGRSHPPYDHADITSLMALDCGGWDPWWSVTDHGITQTYH